ncbi:cytochrome c oxidase assembly protein [Acrasis kona]|uniref:Cytochrome c oxidase assembly protein n=1 Tax=Acrasis kona TaxID=1008807 RepID=A0AAW2YYZ2_9EUKA
MFSRGACLHLSRCFGARVPRIIHNPYTFRYHIQQHTKYSTYTYNDPYEAREKANKEGMKKARKGKFGFIMAIILINTGVFVVLNIPFFKYVCDVSYTAGNYERAQHVDFTIDDISAKLVPEVNTKYASPKHTSKVSRKNLLQYPYGCEMLESDLSDAIVETEEQSSVYKVSFKTSSAMGDKTVLFRPLQEYVYCAPNETNLAFFEAHNPTDRQISGISIYLIHPSEAAPFINKVQCFCFEELSIQSKETVHLPVLFMVDGDIQNKIQGSLANNITINYVLFAK